MLSRKIDKIPGLQEVLDECAEKVSKQVNFPVKMYFRMQFEYIPTKELLRIVMEATEVSNDNFFSPSRKIHHVMARQLFCYFAYYRQKKTTVQIANILNCDHSTVIHNRDKILKMMQSEDEFYMAPMIDIERRITDYITDQMQNPTA